MYTMSGNCLAPTAVCSEATGPCVLLAGIWKEVLAGLTQALGPIPQAERNKVMGETAARFYGLHSRVKSQALEVTVIELDTNVVDTRVTDLLPSRSFMKTSKAEGPVRVFRILLVDDNRNGLLAGRVCLRNMAIRSTRIRRLLKRFSRGSASRLRSGCHRLSDADV